MARLEFWISPTESTSWHLPVLPELGSEVVLDRSVFRVVTPRKSFDPKSTAYYVEFVREATPEERKTAEIALNDLRMSGGWD